MSEDYRKYAAECLALAQAAEDTSSRAPFLAMAELWRSMAEKLEAQPVRQADERLRA